MKPRRTKCPTEIQPERYDIEALRRLTLTQTPRVRIKKNIFTTFLHILEIECFCFSLRPKTEENVEFYFNDLFIENDVSFSSEDSLHSSGISDDEGVVDNEDNQKGGLQMLKTISDNGAEAGPQKEWTKIEQGKESRSLKQERNTRYGQRFS